MYADGRDFSAKRDIFENWTVAFIIDVLEEKNGDITVQCKNITVKGKGPIQVQGKKIEVKSDGDVDVKASGKVKVKGSNVGLN